MAKALESHDICSNPIAGRGKCYESFEKHVRTVVNLEVEVLKVASTYARSEYGRYVKSVLGSEQARQLDEIISGVNTVLATYHDIGKCTMANQKSLRRQGTAPKHEYVSVGVFGAIAELSLAKLGLRGMDIVKAMAPICTAIILHHHAIRGGNIESQPNLKDDDFKCSWRCLETVEDLAGSLLVDEATYMNNVPKLYSEFYKYKYLFTSFRATLPYQPHCYRVASLLNIPLAVADNLSAMINREECLSDSDLPNLLRFLLSTRIPNGFARDLLNRELLFGRLYSKLKFCKRT